MNHDWSIVGIEPKRVGGRGKQPCPKCSHTRKKKSDPCLTVDDNEGWWKCHHCSFSGSLGAYKRLEEVRNKAKMPDDIVEVKYSNKLMKIAEARGISESTLRENYVYERKTRMPGIKNMTDVMCFPVHKDFNLVNVKFRALDVKAFRQISKDHGAVKCFIGLDRIQPEHKEVFIVEGEWDLLTLWECGIKNVLSVPEGAMNKDDSNVQVKMSFLDSYAMKKLEGKVIYLAVDGDDNGDKLAYHLSIRLKRDRCKRVKFPKNYKDLNEVLAGDHGKGLPALGKEGVYKCVQTAQFLRISGIRLVSQEDDNLNKLRERGFERGLMIGNKKIDPLFSVKPKNLVVTTGVPGSGKSTVWEWYYTELIGNNPNKHIHVSIYGPENRPVGRAMAKIMSKYKGKQYYKGDYNPMSDEEVRSAKKWVNNHFAFLSPDNSEKDFILGKKSKASLKSVDGIIHYARICVEQFGTNILMIDPWNKLEHNRARGESEHDYISRTLDKFFEFADLYDVHVNIIAHPTKLEPGSVPGNYKKPGLYDISGSSNWYNKPDTGVVVHRDKWTYEKKDDDKKKPKKRKINYSAPTVISIEKQKFQEVGREGYTELYMDKYQGDIFISQKSKLTKYTGSKQTKMSIEEDPLLPSTASDEDLSEEEVDLFDGKVGDEPDF